MKRQLSHRRNLGTSALLNSCGQLGLDLCWYQFLIFGCESFYNKVTSSSNQDLNIRKAYYK